MFPTADNEEISKHDVIVEEPNRVQVRFPTAYGIFHTMEDRISSPQAFPLDWAADYDHANIDKAFGVLENKLLRIESEIVTASGYFLLPVYFGSLPLFALVLKFPSLFKQETTSFHLYFSALTNLHAAIKVALTDDIIRSELLRSWIAASLKNLSDRRVLEQDGGCTIEERLRVMEEMLFGKSSVDSEHSKKQYKLGDPQQSRNGGVLGKDWKSWLLGIPSLPIKELRSVEAENTRLWKLWTIERRLVEQNHDLRLSRWFEEAEFFSDSDGGHDEWVCKKHLPRLRRLFEVAGFKATAVPAATCHSWLAQTLQQLKELIPKKAGNTDVPAPLSAPRSLFCPVQNAFSLQMDGRGIGKSVRGQKQVSQRNLRLRVRKSSGLHHQQGISESEGGVLQIVW